MRCRVKVKMDRQGFDRNVVEGALGCFDGVLGLQSEVSVLDYTESVSHYERIGFSLIEMFVVLRRDQFVLEYGLYHGAT
jgi:hypothetical protein